MIDTHAHLDKTTSLKGVDKIINVSLDLSLANQHKKVFNAIGYHPYDLKKYNKNKLIKLAKNKKVIAIGEIGLDENQKSNLKNQILFFQKQLAIAKKLDLPVIIHCRGLHEQVLEMIPGYRGVIHCFTSSWKNAQKYLDLGFYISFTGIITYSESYDSLIKKLDLKKILLETDSPFLAPVPCRGQKSEPWMVKLVAQKIAEVKGISYDKVTNQTSQNAQKLFQI